MKVFPQDWNKQKRFGCVGFGIGALLWVFVSAALSSLTGMSLAGGPGIIGALIFLGIPVLIGRHLGRQSDTETPQCAVGALPPRLSDLGTRVALPSASVADGHGWQYWLVGVAIGIALLVGAIWGIAEYEARRQLAPYLLRVELYPKDALALATLADQYRKLRKFRQAESAYKRAIRLNPDAQSIALRLSTMYREMGRKEEADACLRRR